MRIVFVADVQQLPAVYILDLQVELVSSFFTAVRVGGRRILLGIIRDPVAVAFVMAEINIRGGQFLKPVADSVDMPDSRITVSRLYIAAYAVAVSETGVDDDR